MTRIKFTLLVLALLAAPLQAAPVVNPGEIQAIYREWLQAYAERRPADAIAMTSDDFVMVNGEALMDRDEALAFQQNLADFIVSRECTDHMVAFKQLPQKNALLLSRVDCLLHTVIGPLDSHLLETIIVNSKGEIIFNHFSPVQPQ